MRVLLQTVLREVCMRLVVAVGSCRSLLDTYNTLKQKKKNYI